jgi:hypothetical protein
MITEPLSFSFSFSFSFQQLSHVDTFTTAEVNRRDSKIEGEESGTSRCYNRRVWLYNIERSVTLTFRLRDPNDQLLSPTTMARCPKK